MVPALWHAIVSSNILPFSYGIQVRAPYPHAVALLQDFTHAFF